MRTIEQITAELEPIRGREASLKEELCRARIAYAAANPVVQDYAYWLKIYPNGNFPLGVLD